MGTINEIFEAKLWLSKCTLDMYGKLHLTEIQIVAVLTEEAERYANAAAMREREFEGIGGAKDV